MCCKPNLNSSVCPMAQVLSLEKSRMRSYSQGAYKPEWQEFINTVTLRWETRMVSQGSIWNVFGIWYIPTFALFSMRTVTSEDDTGIETMQECYHHFCGVSRGPVPAQSTANLPGHLHSFQEISQTYINPKKIRIYWKAQRNTWSTPRGNVWFLTNSWVKYPKSKLFREGLLDLIEQQTFSQEITELPQGSAS